MSKLLAPVSGVACIVWLSVWSWILSLDIPAEKPIASFPKIQISFAGEDSVFTTQNLPRFLSGSSEIIENANSYSIFDFLAGLLLSDSSKQLIITGYQAQFEKPGQPQKLAMERAVAAKKILILKGIPESSISTEGSEQNGLLFLKDTLLNALQFEFLQNQIAQPAISRSEIAKTAKEFNPSQIVPFIYGPGKYKISDITYTPTAQLDNLRNYLKRNLHKKVTITGYSNTLEQAQTSTNLAEHRAMAVRRYLVDTGLRREQINVAYFPGQGDGDGFSKVEFTIE